MRGGLSPGKDEGRQGRYRQGRAARGGSPWRVDAAGPQDQLGRPQRAEARRHEDRQRQVENCTGVWTMNQRPSLREALARVDFAELDEESERRGTQIGQAIAVALEEHEEPP